MLESEDETSPRVFGRWTRTRPVPKLDLRSLTHSTHLAASVWHPQGHPKQKTSLLEQPQSVGETFTCSSPAYSGGWELFSCCLSWVACSLFPSPHSLHCPEAANTCLMARVAAATANKKPTSPPLAQLHLAFISLSAFAAHCSAIVPPSVAASPFAFLSPLNLLSCLDNASLAFQDMQVANRISLRRPAQFRVAATQAF